MPTSIPPTRPSVHRSGGAAEALVWDELMSQLSADWLVFHGLRLLSGEARARELDFVLVHRLHGMLMVECKGAGLRCERSGSWVRIDPDGRRSPTDDPVEQVESARHALVKAMTERWHDKTGATRIPLVHGHAIITPRASHRANSTLPLALRSDLCWTADDLPHLAQSVERAMSFWRQAATFLPPTLDTDTFRRFRRTCLQPVMQLTPGLRARMAAQQAALMRVSDQQQALLRGLLANPRLHVVGPAGSGKTVLAMAAARQLALAGKRVLLVCYNRPLGDYLSAIGERFLADNELPPSRLVVRNFHRLCHEACDLNPDADWVVPKGRDEARGFWRDEAPHHLLNAISDGHVAPFDAVLVDEAQDFDEAWGEILRLSLHNPMTGQLWLFGDAAQDLYNRGGMQGGSVPRFRLAESHRATKALTAFCAAQLGVPIAPSSLAPQGEAPSLHQLESPSRTRRAIVRVVSDLLSKHQVSPDRITLLTPHRRKNSCLADLVELAGVPLADEPVDRDGRLLHTTISRFKGMESDVVLLLDLDPDDEACTKELVYVGASRARLVLHVWCRGDVRALRRQNVGLILEGTLRTG